MPLPLCAMSSYRHVSHGRYWLCVLLMVIAMLLVNGDTENRDAYGTVLYKLADVDRKKWSFADRVELQCRLIVGSLVPGANISDIDGERFLEYFSLIKGEARKIVSSVARKRAMIAVVDALGGYLHAKLLPLIRQQYYEGRVTYSTAKQLHDLEKNIKYVLGTDGRGWARPVVSVQRSVEDAAPAKRPKGEQPPRPPARPRDSDGSAERCGGADAGQYSLLRRWRPANTTAGGGAADPDGAYADAVPFFDNDTRPHSLVVPWRPGRPVLYGVRDGGCHQTLFDHLATAAAADMSARRSALRQWLDQAVLPLVAARATDQWYPALWGATLVAGRLREADGGGRAGGGRGYRQLDCDWTTADAPNFSFYAIVVLFSASVCWAVCIATRAAFVNRNGCFNF